MFSHIAHVVHSRLHKGPQSCRHIISSHGQIYIQIPSADPGSQIWSRESYCLPATHLVTTQLFDICKQVKTEQ